MRKITGIIFVSMLISLSLCACNTKDEISNKSKQINDYQEYSYVEHYVDEEGNTSNWEVCSKGDILFTLNMQNDILITEWGEIQPLLITNEEPGQYFTKVIE